MSLTWQRAACHNNSWNWSEILIPQKNQRVGTHCHNQCPGVKKCWASRLLVSTSFSSSANSVRVLYLRSFGKVLISPDQGGCPRGLIIINGRDHTTHRDPVSSFRSASPLIRDQSSRCSCVVLCVCLQTRFLPPMGFTSAGLQLHLAFL